ncbi:hypothetical protein BX285_3632 [Streptomyces sp. 1114.5]|uniref:hypothetical protein n=1 Tax=Streptomyces sp. 1114.5 TaxID=1938830 RepID=UPI000F0D9F7A|nr:hypothetical protein [Streptomyces sp. 1114.5]RKT19178.1 hypothetical protein BX285_3632 [Streptomyces sp. 1114.5]
MSTATTEPSTELDELGKFFTIAARRIDAGQTAPEMFSAAIDSAWHQLVGDPVAHDAFALRHAGRKLAHVESSGNGHIAWVSAYEEAYGPLPEIWFTDANGTVNTEALAHYRDTGEVYAEWDCSPAGGDGDDGVVAPEKTTR